MYSLFTMIVLDAVLKSSFINTCYSESITYFTTVGTLWL